MRGHVLGRMRVGSAQLRRASCFGLAPCKDDDDVTLNVQWPQGENTSEGTTLVQVCAQHRRQHLSKRQTSIQSGICAPLSFYTFLRLPMDHRHSNFYPDFFRRTPRRHRRDAVYNWNDEADFLRIDQVSCFGPMLQQDEELVRAGPAIPRVTRRTVELARSATSAYRSQQGTSQPSAGTSQIIAERR